jgi:hypothetical protein
MAHRIYTAKPFLVGMLLATAFGCSGTPHQNECTSLGGNGAQSCGAGGTSTGGDGTSGGVIETGGVSGTAGESTTGGTTTLLGSTATPGTAGMSGTGGTTSNSGTLNTGGSTGSGGSYAAGGTNPCCPVSTAAGFSGSLIQLSGCNLTQWNITLGDALTGNVTAADISREDFDTPECFTRLTANVDARVDVMAHIIAYLPQTVDNPCSHNQEVTYSFRVTDATGRGETVEGGLFSYGGLPDKLDHGMGWQWIVNEENTSAFQHLNRWSTEGNPDGFWTDSGATIEFDQAWHQLTLFEDFDACTASLMVDGRLPLTVPLAHEYKPDFGADITARAQVEAVSRWPGANHTGGGRHRIDVKDWSWTLTLR